MISALFLLEREAANKKKNKRLTSLDLSQVLMCREGKQGDCEVIIGDMFTWLEHSA